MGTEHTTRSGADRTARAVRTQLQAMGCERYEVGLRDTAKGTMIPRTWSVAELEHGITWLKHANAHGHDIYVRPAGSMGLLLLDDLTADAVARMHREGFGPAVVVETSPRNLQVWARVAAVPVDPELATAAARILAAVYGGDPNSADWRHYGRLAGFTNRKPEHRLPNGLQPYVRIHEARGVSVERGAELLDEAGRRLLLDRIEPARPASLPLSPAPSGLRTPGEVYMHYAAAILPRYPMPDYSRLDWMVCCDIASSNLAVDEAYLEQALREGSPSLADVRKRGHVDDYVARTARKVMRDPDVVAARQRLLAGDGQQQHVEL